MGANQANCRFTYNKYDNLNRPIEGGEYNNAADFIQTHSDDVQFPIATDPNGSIIKKFIYDDGDNAQLSVFKQRLRVPLRARFMHHSDKIIVRDMIKNAATAYRIGSIILPQQQSFNTFLRCQMALFYQEHFFHL